MTNQQTEHRSFRFRLGKGRWLADEIAHIETLATDRLRAGISYHSVQTGALALLRLALDGTTGDLVELLAELPQSEPTRERAERDQ